MKIIKVVDENWFKKAPFADVKMVGIKHLGIPADRFAGKQPEPFKRAMVRQVFKQKEIPYGTEYEIMEVNNPFGQPKRRRSATTSGDFEYVWVKNGIRTPKDDIRWEMMRIIEENTSLFNVIKAWESEGHLISDRYESTGEKKSKFTFMMHFNFALKQGWIIKTSEGEE